MEAHGRGHADDVWLLFYAGELHVEGRAWKEAARVLGDAWKKAPKDLRPRFRWSYVLALYKAGKEIQACAAIEPRKDTYHQLVGLLVADKIGAELEALVAEYRPHAGKDADLLYHQARAKVLLKQPEAAIPLLQKAYQQATQDYRRREYVTGFVLDMAEAGSGLEAYRAAPDQQAAFETLARNLVSKKEDQALAELLKEHGKSHVQDPWHAYFRGEMHLLRGEAEPAEQCFALTRLRPRAILRSLPGSCFGP
jgi:hypothetical protein